MKLAVKKFLLCRSGATAVEYALLATGMAVAIVSASKLVGTTLNVIIGNIAANTT